MATTVTSAQTDWRQEWFEFEDATYLNLAGQSPMPRVSLRAVQTALEAKKFPHHKPDFDQLAKLPMEDEEKGEDER